MKAHALMAFAAASVIVVLTAGCARPTRHAPDAHMNQDAQRYSYDYDDGICTYHYQYDFKTLKDNLEQKGDCRNVPIERAFGTFKAVKVPAGSGTVTFEYHPGLPYYGATVVGLLFAAVVVWAGMRRRHALTRPGARPPTAPTTPLR